VRVCDRVGVRVPWHNQVWYFVVCIVITPTVQEKRRLNGLAKAQQLLTDFLAVLEREYDWEPSRVFLLGFSQVRVCVCVCVITRSLTLVCRALWLRSGWR
jgi:hypothetical protein